MFFLIKVILSALVIAAASELAKRNDTLAALLIALPLVSLLSMTWLYIETKDSEKVAQLSQSIFWMVLPTLIFFLILPWMLRHGFRFWISLSVSSAIMIAVYSIYSAILKKLGATL